MRFFRALCATLGALLITSTVVFGAHAADGPTLSEAYVLTKDGQLVDTLTVVDPSRTMSESACTPYAGSSTDQHVEFVTRDDATVCHMQLMYTRAQDESEFTLQDSGAFVLSARTDQTLAEYRKAFGSSLSFASVSLSIEGEVKSATSGAATSATTYEGRALSVSTWTDTVPQVITVNGTLAPGGNPAAADGANALKDPWGATPIPGNENSSDSASSAASDSPSDPPLGLLIGLIVGLIVIVLVVVIVIYVIRSKRSTQPTEGTQHSTVPSHMRRPSAPRGTGASAPYAPGQAMGVPAQSSPAPVINQGRGGTSSPEASRRAPSTNSARQDLASLPQPKPRDTGFVWEHKSRPAPTAPAPGAPVQAAKPPKRKRSRDGHRPAVFPAQPMQTMQPTQPMQEPNAAAAHYAPSFPQGQGAPSAAQAPQASANRYAPAVPATPAPAPAPEDIPTPARGIPSRGVSEMAGHAHEADQQQAVAAIEHSPTDSSYSSSVPVPPPSVEDAPETMLIPKVQHAVVPEPEPVVVPEPEPVVVPEPEPVVVPEPEPVVVPEPEPVVVPEPEPVVVPEPEPEPVVVPEPEPIAIPEPEPVVVPEPEPIAIPEPEPVIVPEPEPIAIPEPEPVIVPEPEPIVVPEPEPIVVPEPEPVVVPEPEPVVVPEPEPEPVVVPKPEPIVVPEPEPIAIPEPEPVVVPEPEPEPVVVPKPEPVVVPKPEPVVVPEPEPIAIPEPEPVVVPEPEPVVVPEPEVASFGSVDDNGEMPTAQFPRVRRVNSVAWSTSTRSESAPAVAEPGSAFTRTPPAASPRQESAPAAPAVQAQSAAPYVPAALQVAPIQEPPVAPQTTQAPPVSPQTTQAPFAPQTPAPPQAQAMPQAPITPQAPAMPASLQEDWNSEFSWNEEARREQEGESKRRKRWGWGKRRKQREDNNEPIESENEEQTSSARMPMISVDAQDDDWNDWQNWNSRS